MFKIRSLTSNSCTSILKKSLFQSKYVNFSPIQTSNLHELVPIPSGLKTNFPLYPKTSMFFIQEELEKMVNKLNNIVAGTKYEYETLYKTINRSAASPEDHVIFNLSSQIWNLSFFIQQLSSKQVGIKADLQQRLSQSFGSLIGFQQNFVAAAQAVVGNGWTWLVEDENGELKIVNTLEAGTPLIPGRMQMTQGLTYETVNTHLPNTSLPWTLSPSVPRGSYIPILNLNLWQSGYIADFELDVQKYATIFLNQVNWNVIRSRLIRNLD